MSRDDGSSAAGWWVTLVVVAAGCGRVGFTPWTDASREPRDVWRDEADAGDGEEARDGADGDAPDADCTPETETCNGLDDDCDGWADEGAGGFGSLCDVLALGDAFTCMLRADRSLQCWGSTNAGRIGVVPGADQPAPVEVPVEGVAEWVSVASGDGHTCAVSALGALYCTGVNDYGQCADPLVGARDAFAPSPAFAPLRGGWAAVTAGFDHACGLRAGGELYCWGRDSQGQLGSGGAAAFGVATPVGTGRDWRLVSAGSLHTCGIRGGGELYCWGRNTEGQLGDGTTEDASSPVRVLDDTASDAWDDWRVVAAGARHTCALRADHTLWCWGARRAVGSPGGSFALLPERVGDAADWRAVAGGEHFACGIREPGALYCWGLNGYGQLGLGTAATHEEPARVGGDDDWLTVRASQSHTCGARRDGSVWCWGTRVHGEVGDGTVATAEEPARVDSLAAVTIAAGLYHTCALDGSGVLHCTGWNSYGQLGSDAQVSDTFEALGAGAGWTGVAAGAHHACALDGARAAWCWGRGLEGQLGAGPGIGASVEVRAVAAGPAAWQWLSAASHTTCGVGEDGSLWCWGENGSGQLGDGTGASRDVPTREAHGFSDWVRVAVGSASTCGLREDGAATTLWCWGANADGRLGLGDTADRDVPVQVGGDSDWQEVAVHGHACGRKRTGELYCWGRNTEGQLGDGSGAEQHAPSRVAGLWDEVAVGSQRTCGVRDDGTLWCWGRNDEGRLGLGDRAPATLPRQVDAASGWARLAGGVYHACARRAGDLYCWGWNGLGQLGTGDAFRRSPARVAF